MTETPKRRLGKSGLLVSVLGLGGITLQRIGEAATTRLLDALAEQGVNFIDTARGYSVSEEYLGAALQGRRHKFILASKSMARNREAMSRDIETSLRNFRTDYIDLYQLHFVSVSSLERAFDSGGAVAAIEAAIREGKVGHLGATAHSPEAFRRMLDYPQIETTMFPYNIVETQGAATMRLAREKDIGFIAMKPMAGGNIADATLALRYIMNDSNCDVALVGMAELSEVAENCAAVLDNSPLGQGELARIEEIRAELGDDFCRRCGYCAPCTVGINIPSVLTMAIYATRYQLNEWASSHYAAYRAHAGECIGCGECEKRCPYHLQIREKLAAVKELFGQ